MVNSAEGAMVPMTPEGRCDFPVGWVDGRMVEWEASGSCEFSNYKTVVSWGRLIFGWDCLIDGWFFKDSWIGGVLIGKMRYHEVSWGTMRYHEVSWGIMRYTVYDFSIITCGYLKMLDTFLDTSNDGRSLNRTMMMENQQFGGSLSWSEIIFDE